MEDSDLEDTSLANRPKKILKKISVQIQNRPSKTTIYCKSNGKPKLQTCLSQNYDFVFTNLLKNEAEWQMKKETIPKSPIMNL